MSRNLLSSLLVGAVLPLSACGTANSEPDVAATGTDDSEPGRGTVTVSSAVLSSDGTPLDGVDVCTLPGHSISSSEVRCVTSGKDGSFRMSELPAKGQVALTFEKAGYQATLRAFETGSADLALPTGETLMFPLSGGTLGDPNLGRIEFQIETSGGEPAAPVSITLMGSDGNSKPALYFASGGSLQTTPSSNGHGLFPNLATDEYLMVVQGGTGCTANGLYGYPLFQDPDALPGAAVIAVRVVEGYLTTPIHVACEGRPNQVAQ